MQILAVMVRYKMGLTQSETLSSLCRSFETHPDLLQSVGLLIWDNSPLPLNDPQLSIPFQYRHTGENLGVSGAYNRALEIAESQGCPWLLLLDQDTTLPGDFLPRMIEYSRAQDANTDIAAIAPLLIEGDGIISPLIVQPNRVKHAKPVAQPFTGVYGKELFAANSGTLMRVSSLRSIGGFDENFWLDISDVVVFHRLYRQEMCLYVAGDIRVQHRVTNNDYDGSMSPERYRNFIAAEGAYWDLYGTATQNVIQTARLFARVIKQYLRFRNKIFSRITREFLGQRLFSSKATRIQLWKRQSRKRDIPAISGGQVVG